MNDTTDNPIAPGDDVNVLVALSLSISSHLWQEFHAQAPTNIYQGAVADDRRVVERLDDDGVLVAKENLHLCFLECAVSTIDVVVPFNVTCYAKWEILDSRGTVIKSHSNYNANDYDACASAATLANGKHGWLWSGRNSANSPVFVSAGTYRSRITIKDVNGTEVTSEVPLELQGEPYRIFVAGVPKTNSELAEELARSAYDNRILSSAGQRSARDCWIKVWRGQQDDGHITFLGHGTIEATKVPNGTAVGAVATPHGRPYKGFIRPDPHSEAVRADRLQIEDEGVTNGRIMLLNPGGASPINPYSTNAGAYKDGVQAHGGRTLWTSDGMSVGCTTVSPVAGADLNHPGATAGEVRSINSSFGEWGDNSASERVSNRGPSFDNKQTKRNRTADALIVDDHECPQLDPPEHPTPNSGASRSDEPLHMQSTLQTAAFGGFLGHEIPRSMGVDDDPRDRLRIRVTLENPAEGGYQQYHRAVVFGHSWDEPSNPLTRVTVWIPRKVIRGWNGNAKNVLVRGQCQIAWWIEHRDTLQTCQDVIHCFFPTSTGTGLMPDLTDLPNGYIGRTRKTWTRPESLDPGVYVSVLRYRLHLNPYVAGNDAWEAEEAANDMFITPGANGGATLFAETISTVGNRQYLYGRSELVVWRES